MQTTTTTHLLNQTLITLHGIPKDADIQKRRIAQSILSNYKDVQIIVFLMPNGDIYIRLLIQGKASIIGGKELEQQNELLLLEKAHRLLSRKYVQYQKIGIGKYIIMIIPQKVISWNIID
jgi:hypothetical protein